jgi:hypothetical protein
MYNTPQDWVGLTLHSGERIDGILSEGSEHIVFKAGADVVKIRRNHIGFLIGLPPDGVFNLNDIDRHQKALFPRLRSLAGLAAVGVLYPFDGLWNALAVSRLGDADPTAQTVNPGDFDTLIGSSFVIDRLKDWSSMVTGRSSDELAEIVVIQQGYRQIYADFPGILAQSATQALGLCGKNPQQEHDVQNNPVLPWLIASASGYTLPRNWCSAMMETPCEFWRNKSVVRQTGQLCKFLFVNSGIRALEKATVAAGILMSLGACERGTELCQIFQASYR